MLWSQWLGLGWLALGVGWLGRKQGHPGLNRLARSMRMCVSFCVTLTTEVAFSTFTASEWVWGAGWLGLGECSSGVLCLGVLVFLWFCLLRL